MSRTVHTKDFKEFVIDLGRSPRPSPGGGDLGGLWQTGISERFDATWIPSTCVLHIRLVNRLATSYTKR